MNATSKLLLFVAGAAAAGAVIGMLVAPEKGSVLRHRIRSSADNLADQLKELGNSSRKKIREAKNDMVPKPESNLVL